MRVKWKKRALNQLFAIHRFLNDRNSAAAQSVVIDIQHSAKRLKEFPHLGHPGERVGVFELQVPGTLYVLPYRTFGDVIEILSVFDQRRNPEEKP